MRITGLSREDVSTSVRRLVSRGTKILACGGRFNSVVGAALGAAHRGRSTQPSQERTTPEKDPAKHDQQTESDDGSSRPGSNYSDDGHALPRPIERTMHYPADEITLCSSVETTNGEVDR